MNLHVAVIMDGNRRWAQSQDLLSNKGHEAGVKALQNIIKICPELNIKYLTVYAFSSENWQRSELEVQFLLQLFNKMLDKETENLHANNICLKFLSNKKELPQELQDKIQKAEELTQNNNLLNLQIALNYGARQELTQVVQEIIKNPEQEININTINKYLYTKNIPDPDIVIRTGGEKRVSNFLLWQIAYSELFFTDTLWPDFTVNELENILNNYAKRQRRFGH